MHKAGSTSIQLSLQHFEDDHFLYARLGGDSNHSLPIYSLFAEHPERHHLHRSGGRSLAAVQKYNASILSDLERSVTAAGKRTLIISGEDISALPESDLPKLRNYFDERFDDVLIVGYVRPPAGFMASSFQQGVKSGKIKSFQPKRLYRSYEVSFAKFDRIFGRERVQLWKFDPAAFPEADVVQDFCVRLSIPLPRNEVVRMNESLVGQAVAALYTYNKLGIGADANPLNGYEGAELGRHFKGEKFRFAPDIIRPVLTAKRADIEWMEARLGQSLHEEIGDDRPGDVRGEADLLRPNPQSAAVLLKSLGPNVPLGVEGNTPEEIALLVGALRRTIPARKKGWLRSLIDRRRPATRAREKIAQK